MNDVVALRLLAQHHTRILGGPIDVASYVESEASVLINVTARKIVAAPGSVIYNVVDISPEGLEVGPGEVLAGVFDADGNQTIIRSSLAIDGGLLTAKFWLSHFCFCFDEL